MADVIRSRGGLAVAGLLMKQELDYLGAALESPRRPFIAILGGAKISGKIDVIEALLPKTDRLLIGGAMANTFFRALELGTGDSLIEEDRIEMARDLKPDVVLMDLRMPGLSGAEATSRIRDEQPHVQVIILSAYDDPALNKSAEEAGAYAYLVKGCSASLVRDVLFEAFKLKRGLDTSQA